MISIPGDQACEGGGRWKSVDLNVVIRCSNVVGSWLISARFFDQSGEEEDWDEEEEGGGVMIGCVGQKKEQDGEKGCEKGECLPSTNFWCAGHRWH